MQKVWMQRSEQVLFEQLAVIDMGHFWEKNLVWSLQSNNKHNNLFRPATADSRFRFWKTWLVEQMEADEKEPQDVKEKKEQNVKKYWFIMYKCFKSFRVHRLPIKHKEFYHAKEIAPFK